MLLLIQLFFNNGIYLFAGGLTFWIIFFNLQQPYKPSIFTIAFLYHLVQIMAGVWLCNYLGKEIDFRSPHQGTATIVAYCGLIIMFIPIIYYQNKLPNISLQSFRKSAFRLSITNTFKAYIIAFFSMNALGGIAFLIPGLTQVIFSFINIKWFLFLLFGLQVILKKQMVKEFAIICAAEFILGFFSYFSDFKTILFFLIFLSIIFLCKVKFVHALMAVLGIGLLFYLGVMWTSIKGEYRAFLNKGSKTQTVQVEREAAFSKLIELSGNRDENSFDNAASSFFDRLQYTYHLAKTMDRVPSELPYEYGGNIAKIIEFVTTPRFLNPNKPALEATVKTIKYTGLRYSGAKKGVSFSLGYFADCYIDFGYFGMMLPLLILGFIFGSTYFYFLKNSSDNFVFNYAVVGAMFMEFIAFEADGTYLMGRLFATLVTFFILKLFFFPGLYKYLKSSGTIVKPASEEKLNPHTEMVHN